MQTSPSRQEDLRVAVVGAGRMGADHVERLAHRVQRSRVSAVVDVDAGRAAQAASAAPGAETFSGLAPLLETGAADAVLLATPGFLHEEALLQLIEAGMPVLCEKPLTPDAASALRVVQAEAAFGRQLIQVGFMRRFDAGYRRLKEVIDSGQLGELLMLHHQHRNPNTPPGFTEEMVINDSVVHEFDAVRFFTGEEIRSVQVRVGRRTSLGDPAVRDPQHVVIETSSGLLAEVEMFCSAQLGYQVATQATFERGVVAIGGEDGLRITEAGHTGYEVPVGFVTRFRAAYDVEIQDWVDAVHAGAIAGPSAWDGYATAACCEAGVASQRHGGAVDVALAERPAFYA
ncbi:Gfo/Idh/MocA family oxidoreductase [Nesterenkonia massiliensis]|uniref:Inositol 2-dehydrogenase n=1 Tax=Nesterenkonia massiliensis TaxID=1232429 RepID=A0ABT2HPD6_9MICC|nr:Gfo/Idh/MocA family oxidoreductase [Nesterenkonia massiliensis]MCT1606536.1 Gfo/Idh/MocA family oxidoreductase [Nesterenkonia massiliensis]